MARGRRRRRRRKRHKYKTLLDFVRREDIYLVNLYGNVFKIAGTATDSVSDSLTRVGQNAVGIVFAGCLVLLPADVAVKNLGYLRQVLVPRSSSLVTRKGTRVYDLRKDLQGLYDGEWTRVNFDKAAREFWDVVGEHRYPYWDNYPIFKYLMLETGVDLNQSGE